MFDRRYFIQNRQNFRSDGRDSKLNLLARREASVAIENKLSSLNEIETIACLLPSLESKMISQSILDKVDSKIKRDLVNIGEHLPSTLAENIAGMNSRIEGMAEMLSTFKSKVAEFEDSSSIIIEMGTKIDKIYFWCPRWRTGWKVPRNHLIPHSTLRSKD